jgi:hypothetical protein
VVPRASPPSSLFLSLSLSLTGSGIALFAVRFVSCSSFLFRRFFFATFSRGGSLNSSFFLSSSLRARARALVIYRGYPRVDTDPTRYSPATLFFSTFFCVRPRWRENAMLLLFLPCSCARDDRLSLTDILDRPLLRITSRYRHGYTGACAPIDVTEWYIN